MRRIPSAVRAVGSALLLAAGCALNPPLDLSRIAQTAGPVELAGVPFHPQEAHHCGPASLLTVLEASGVETDYGTVVDRAYVPGLEGSLQAEMLAAARSFGRIAYVLPPEPRAVLAEIGAGRPVLVLLNLGVPSAPVWHYAVVVGFEPEGNRMLLHSGRTAGSRQRAPAWLRRWDWAGRWGMVVLRPGEWPRVPHRERLLRALAEFEDVADPRAAGRAWQTAVERWPEEAIAWLGVGNAAQRLGDVEAALEGYREALRIDPQHLPARLNLALALAQDERSCDGLRELGAAPAAGHPLEPAYRELEVRLLRECSTTPQPGASLPDSSATRGV